MKWDVYRVVSALAGIPGVHYVATNSPGSEMTTEQLVYSVEGANDRLYVCGFVTDPSKPLDASMEIEMVEVTSEYSDGGDSPEPANVIARAMIQVALMKLGYSVVKDLGAYF